MSMEIIITAFVTFLFTVLGGICVWLKSKHPNSWIVTCAIVSGVEVITRACGKKNWGMYKKQAVMRTVSNLNDKLHWYLTQEELDRLVEQIVAKMNYIISLLHLEDEEGGEKDEK